MCLRAGVVLPGGRREIYNPRLSISHRRSIPADNAHLLSQLATQSLVFGGSRPVTDVQQVNRLKITYSLCSEITVL